MGYDNDKRAWKDLEVALLFLLTKCDKTLGALISRELLSAAVGFAITSKIKGAKVCEASYLTMKV